MGTRVYIGDLGSGGSKPELEKAFENYGSLRSVWVARNPPGFAFVEFDRPEDAEKAVRELDGEKVCGTHIRVELAKDSSKAGSRGDRGGRHRSPNRSYRSRSRSPGRRYRSPDRRYRSPDRRRGYGRSPSPPYRREYSPRRYY